MCLLEHPVVAIPLQTLERCQVNADLFVIGDPGALVCIKLLLPLATLGCWVQLRVAR